MLRILFLLLLIPQIACGAINPETGLLDITGASIGDGTGGWTDGGTTITTTTTTDKVGIGTTTVLDGILQVVSDNVAIGVGGTNSNATGAGDLYVTSDLEVDGTAYLNIAQVTDDAYAVGWDSSTAVPTKNAVYDKIESLGASSGGWTDEGTVIHPSTTTDNVGIGTTDAGSYKLRVVGTVYATQYDTAPSNAPTTTYSPILAGDTHWTLGMNSDGGGNNNDPLYLAEGTDITASQRVAILPGGNMGIGTTYPQQALQVNGTVQSTGIKMTTSPTNGYVLTSDANGVGSWAVGASQFKTTSVGIGTTGLVGVGTYGPSAMLEVVKVGTNAPLMISSTATGDGDYLIINSSGNVGIGTVTPELFEYKGPAADWAVLTIRSQANMGSAIDFNQGTANKGNVYFDPDLNAFILNDDSSTTNGTSLSPIAGNVGIGTWKPSGKLEVKTSGGNITMATSGGNVGIGSLSPGTTLDIGSGSLRIGIGTTTAGTILCVKSIANSRATLGYCTGTLTNSICGTCN